ncbi:MAG: hypothetical protein M5R36_30035 [Deltaproteobacteria bacterium]|nr:hypothetical protein [Deltaproteobacteria bacterium]
MISGPKTVRLSGRKKILDDLRRLVDLEGKSFPEKRRLAKAEKALDQPEFSLVLSGAGGEELAVVTMASFSDKGERVVIGRGRPPGVTMELDPSALDGWPERAEDWMAPPEEAARETADDDTAAEAE